MKLGELFAGYGGLGMAVMEAFPGTELAWYAEFEKAPSQVMAHHWPHTPNHGDVTTVDWSSVEPVDIISGGSPCQDLSLAGARKGMTQGTRSGLWESMREAIATIQPRYVVWENVKGALSAKATSSSDLEHRTGLLGERPAGHLRALGRVLGDLTDLGYDTEWATIRASDIGAPHRRERVFLLATHTNQQGLQRPHYREGEAPTRRRGHAKPSTHPSDYHHSAPANTEHDGQSASPVWGSDGTTTQERTRAGSITTYHDGQPTGGHPTDRGPGHLQEPEALTNARSKRLSGERQPRQYETPDHPAPGYQRDTTGRDSPTIKWGAYEPAIRRWERSLGRVAPAPTKLSAQGKPQLSPVFVEWMMGLDEGHITGIDGVSRAEQLKMLGNGVVPQQAATALSTLLNRHNTKDKK